MKTTLDKVEEGQKCLILKLNIDDKAYKKRFSDLGLIEGMVISIFKKQPGIKGLIIISCFNTKLMMRKEDICKIEVKVLQKQINNVNFKEVCEK